jgi:hypothetical protein
LLSTRPDDDAILTRWRTSTRTKWGLDHCWAALDGTAMLLRLLLAGKGEPRGLITEVGRRWGMDGHPLAAVTAWLGDLVTAAPHRARRRLDHAGSAIALAAGWAEGALERRHHLAGGLEPIAALEQEIERQYDHCDALGLDITDSHTLVVLEADGDAGGGLWARAGARTALADHARRCFRAGEPLGVSHGGRVLVLAQRSPELPTRVTELVADAQASPFLLGYRISGWVEPLARDRAHLPSHLSELAAEVSFRPVEATRSQQR